MMDSPPFSFKKGGSGMKGLLEQHLTPDTPIALSDTLFERPNILNIFACETPKSCSP